MSEIRLKFNTIKGYCEYNKIKPRFHGNGFVQLDITDKQRLNVWPRQRLQIQKTYTQIHDHTFSFKSRVIAGNGRLIHKVYEPWFHKDGDMQLYKAVKTNGQNTHLQPIEDGRCDMVIQSECRIWNEYSFEKGMFHETVADGLVMTIMEKTEKDDTLLSRVAGPYGETPDNSFDRHNTVDTDYCWYLISEAFDRINRHWVNPFK